MPRYITSPLTLQRRIGITRAAPSTDIYAYRDKVLGYSPTIYYMMAEASGTTAIDSSGNGYNGTYANVTLGQTGVGDGLTSADFNGSSSTLTTPNISAIFDGNEYSFALWTQIDDWATDWQRFLQWWVDGSNQGDLSIFSTNGWIAFDRTAGGVFDDAKGNTGSPAGTTWLHLAATVSDSGDIMKVYFNATAQADTGTSLGTFSGAPTTINIGSAGGSQYLNGRLAHLGIWYGTVLGQSDITDLATV